MGHTQGECTSSTIRASICSLIAQRCPTPNNRPNRRENTPPISFRRAPSNLPRTVGELRAAGHRERGVKQEIRENLLTALAEGDDIWPGILGFEDTVLPQLERAYLTMVRDVTAFLTLVWRDGALFGRTPQEAFFVKCDAETNPPEERDAGRVVCLIGVAPVKPAEFVVFKLSQTSGGAEIETIGG